MERIGAKDLDHHAIALRVFEELDGAVERVGWWTQAVTVAYEQDVGRRVPGQRPDGTYQTSVSRATSMSMTDLMDQWTAYAADDTGVQGLVVAGSLRVSGTDRRITWRANAVVSGRGRVWSSRPVAWRCVRSRRRVRILPSQVPTSRVRGTRSGRRRRDV